jgi:GNAT superfamily N-acetyltransferase
VTDAAIRQAGQADLAVLARLRREQAAGQQGEYSDPGFGQRFAAWQEREAAFALAEYRNQGIGRHLLGAVLGHARQHGFARVVLSPSERSVPFYRRAGFGPAGALLLWTP